MKWRCPQCGKPHERNDPPCDNCGHHKLERAVVPHASETEGRDQFVWACTECGRHHQRNNPPCSRCGNSKFEKKPLEYDEFDPGDTKGYRELIGRQEVAMAAVIVFLVGVGVLGYLGVVTLPGITPQGPPTVEDVPGDSERVDDLALADVEAEVLADIDSRREAAALQRSEGLDDMATYFVRLTAKEVLTNEDQPIDRENFERFETPCNGLPSFAYGTSSHATGDTAKAVADRLSVSPLSDSPPPTEGQFSLAGIGTHAGPDGTVFVVVAYC